MRKITLCKFLLDIKPKDCPAECVHADEVSYKFEGLPQQFWFCGYNKPCGYQVVGEITEVEK